MWKVILNVITTNGPRFLNDLTGLLSGPKTFLRGQDLTTSDSVNWAVTFYILSITASFCIELPFVNTSKELSILFSARVVLFIVGTLIFSGITKLSFLLFGGKGSLFSHFVVTLYISGPASIFLSMGLAASNGVVLYNDPDLYPLFKEFRVWSIMGIDFSNLDRFFPILENISTIIAFILFFIVILLLCIWTVICWGGYRCINGTTKRRSFGAFVLLSVLSLPVSYILISAQQGLGIAPF